MLSDYNIEALIGGLLVLASYLYAAFWAFNIRKGLTVKLYRNQALGIGLVAIGLAFFAAVFDQLIPSTGFGSEVANFITFALLFFATLPLFYWTDQSLQAAQQSDPLERDQFHWSKVRKILWIILCVGLITDVTLDTTSMIVCTFPTLSSASYPCPAPNFAPGLFGVLGIVFFFAIWGIPLTTSAILLPFAWRRSNDITFRRHLKWFAIAAISLGFSTVSAGYLSSMNNMISLAIPDVLYLLTGYFLFRSARAVVPLYRFKDKTNIA